MNRACLGLFAFWGSQNLDIEKLKSDASGQIGAAKDLEALNEASVRWLGRKGALSEFMRRIPELEPDSRREAGQKLNALKKELEALLEAARERISGSARALDEGLDISLPGRPVASGSIHPINQVMEEICDIFVQMGFDVVEGPEVELDWYNFEALNFPPDHPARDMQDTFFVSGDVVLRTHTSSLQIRTMESTPPPVKVIAPGKVYRCDSDVTHTPMFHQVEGLLVGDGISFADLKGTLTLFVQKMYGPNTPIRLRPSFFPFTEPSAEVDIGCVICRGSGCRVCSGTGWLEVLGSGMVHPNVFENVGYDSSLITGFAFGLGVERIAMLKYGVDDLRRFFENDLRFLSQF